MSGYVKLNTIHETYAIYSLFTENPRFSNKIVSTKICVSSKATYKIYNYDKMILSVLDDVHSKYRSVIFSYPENILFSFSPPKSIEYFDFMKKYPKINDPIVITEKIEGIAVNLFYDMRIHSWEISTKTSIGGNYWYFANNTNNTNIHYCKKPSTFYDMFLDALIQPRNTPLNNIAWISQLPKNCSYSFVLQHPENQIVIPIKSPKLWMVAVYEIGDHYAIQIPSVEYKHWPSIVGIVGVVTFPKELKVDNYVDLLKYISKYTNHPFRMNKGIHLWNERTGDRTVLKNPVYADLIELRRISPIVQYEYFCMKRIGTLEEYIELCPYAKKMVNTMEHMYTDFIKTMHKCYLNVYVFKTESIDTICDQFRPYIENIHKHEYLPSIRTREPVKVTKLFIREYLDKMEPREQLFIFSYLRRECDNYNFS
jgi:hypothetical protein